MILVHMYQVEEDRLIIFNNQVCCHLFEQKNTATFNFNIFSVSESIFLALWENGIQELLTNYNL